MRYHTGAIVAGVAHLGKHRSAVVSDVKISYWQEAAHDPCEAGDLRSIGLRPLQAACQNIGDGC